MRPVAFGDRAVSISRAQINKIKDFDLRTILLGMLEQHLAVGGALGINLLEPTNSPQKALTPPPPVGSLSVVGANGAFTIAVTNAPQSINKAIYNEVSYSPSSNFSTGVVVLPVSTATHQVLAAPGITVYWRLRSSYDQANWNAYVRLPGTVSSGLQSSAASDHATVLNQTNYATVDSVAVGGTANIRVFGKGGPLTQYPAVKGAVETILPSATIINVPLSSQQVVGYDGNNYQVRTTLPQQLVDGIVPTGTLSVVGGGAVTLPTVSLILGSGGVVLAWNVITQGNGLTAPVTLTIVTSTGSGATAGPQTIVAGKLISISPGNPGTAYAGGDTVTVSGGSAAAGLGGGQNIGGNGGRFIVNDGTTN
jgi:hypothetical protein